MATVPNAPTPTGQSAWATVQGKVAAASADALLFSGAAAGIFALSEIINFIQLDKSDLDFTFNPPPFNTVIQVPEEPNPDSLSVEFDDAEVSAADPGSDWDALVGDDNAYLNPDIGTDYPDAPGSAPSVDTSGQPSALTATPPTDDPTISDVTLPAAPDTTLPAVPDLEDIVIPTVPAISYPTFSSTVPEIDFAVPADVEVDFQNTAFTDDLLDDVKANLARMQLGGTGLPLSVETALFDRGRGREDVLAMKAVQEATEEWSARGFSLPTGVLNAKIAAARQANQNKASELERDIVIKASDIEIENLRFSVTQGIAWLSLFSQIHNNAEDRRLRAMIASSEALRALFAAQVELYSSRLRAFATEAEVYKARLEGEALKLQAFKSEIEAQALVSEINKTSVEIYKAQTQALEVAVNIYKAQIEGVKATVEVDKTRIEAVKAKVDSYKARVDAYVAEWDGYRSKMQAEVSRVQAYQYEAQAYGELVRALSTRDGIKIERAKLEISKRQGDLDAYRAQVARFAEVVNKERSRTQSYAQLYESEVRRYLGNVQLNEAIANRDSKNAELTMEGGRISAELYLKKADMLMSESLKQAAIHQATMEAAGRVFGQLAAAALSTVHVAATVASSDSEAKGWQVNYAASETGIQG